MTLPSLRLPASLSRRRPPIPVPEAVTLLLLTLLTAVAEPNDEACLSNLRSSLEDPANTLRNWTKSTFASPCNGFTSYLDGATCNNGRIYKLYLPSRSLKGSISPFLSYCTNLQTLDLSSNFLTGDIPAELSSLLNLAVLNLSSNSLSGQIPPQLALCAYLNVIDLHANELSGPIPDQLGLLVRLSSFDVSYNRLEGPIPALLANRTGPAGGLPLFNASSFVGNRDLYGYPLPPMRGRGLSVLAIVGIGLGSGMISLILSFTAVCIWLRLKEANANAAAGGGGGLMNGEEGKISHLMPY
ncbi:putative LRR receptor-like serine/threonine-protein kinase [Apostasia shenzhenica]|uniref:Putative LRR receptor-like serine/threonine-protein kinase n=1 Tax=Apostasia shenzhenica TaxID=1088818 RepID=A0A2I0A2A3_9ASPA|nr:putative LRR receptor-like serine/threonine-protein kinase [Apostasia shenzhenica]